jgi:hypothetical protein
MIVLGALGALIAVGPPMMKFKFPRSVWKHRPFKPNTYPRSHHRCHDQAKAQKISNGPRSETNVPGTAACGPIQWPKPC